MQHARRLASFAVIAAVGALALTGCRSQPDVAAYLGDQQITEDRVTGVIDEARQQPVEGAEVKPPTRGVVLSTLVLNDVCQQFAAEQKLPAGQQAPVDQIAAQLGVSADSEFAKETAQLYTCLSGLPTGEPVTPSPDLLLELGKKAKAAGVIEDQTVSDAAAGQQLDGDQLRAALGNEKALDDVIAKFNVTVNPRYRPLQFPILSFPDQTPAVSVTLGEDGTGSVVEGERR